MFKLFPTLRLSLISRRARGLPHNCRLLSNIKEPTDAKESVVINDHENSPPPKSNDYLNSQEDKLFEPSSLFKDDSQSHSYSDDDSLTRQILEVALQYVSKYGWSSKSIDAAMEALEISQSSSAMFKRKSGDLVLFFIDECNNSLSEQMSSLQQEYEKSQQFEFIEIVIQKRLRMIAPYIETWPQAMVQLASPGLLIECFETNANMIDEIWYHSGDLSTSIDWYMKRLTLAGIYTATELHMLQDKSVDFENTWSFLNRRLNEFKQLEACDAKTFTESLKTDILSLGNVTLLTAKNIFGYNRKF